MFSDFGINADNYQAFGCGLDSNLCGCGDRFMVSKSVTALGSSKRDLATYLDYLLVNQSSFSHAEFVARSIRYLCTDKNCSSGTKEI